MSDGFRHTALLYDGMDGFLAGTVPFLEEAVAGDEPALVVVGEEKIDRLSTALGEGADRVAFLDMSRVGLNPARIIPAWQSFIDDHLTADQPVRGIGEPIWAGRDPDALVEAQRHEALLNTAFAGTSSWQLLCPYDVAALDADALETAEVTHPTLLTDDGMTPSSSYRDVKGFATPFDDALQPPPAGTSMYEFGGASLTEIRGIVRHHARDAGAGLMAEEDMVLAADEACANSIRYGGGGGTLLIWTENGSLFCEVRDRGSFVDPLADRRPPDPGHAGGAGLWIANQLCDLVQIRSTQDGTVVRLRKRFAR